MTFEYIGAGQQSMGLQYPGLVKEETPQQNGMQIDPETAMNIGQQFMGGGTETGAVSGGGSSGGGSAVASAGPWAALAAIIAVNEYNAVKGGYRSKDKSEYAKDLFSGEVLHQDLEKRWLPKLGIKEDSKLSKGLSIMAMPLGADPEKSWGRIKDLF